MNITIDEVIASYEAAARANRPDWDQFIIDATADPCEVGCEMVDHYRMMCDERAKPGGLDPDDVHDAGCEWVQHLRNPRRIPGTNRVREVKEMRLLHEKGQYILDQGRDERIVTIKTSSNQFVIVTDATGIEQVIDRVTFDESAVLVSPMFASNRYLYGVFTSTGLKTVGYNPTTSDITNCGIADHPELYWVIDLNAVSEEAYVQGYTH